MKEVKLESIVSFRCIEQFNDCTGQNYDDLDDDQLFDCLEQWHYPGEHDVNSYDIDYINTAFLGYQYKDTNYIMSRYENGLVIALSYITEDK